MFNYKLNYGGGLEEHSLQCTVRFLFSYFFFFFERARARAFAAVISFSFCNRRPYLSAVGRIFAVKVSAYEIQLVDNGKMLENTN